MHAQIIHSFTCQCKSQLTWPFSFHTSWLPFVRGLRLECQPHCTQPQVLNLNLTNLLLSGELNSFFRHAQTHLFHTHTHTHAAYCTPPAHHSTHRTQDPPGAQPQEYVLLAAEVGISKSSKYHIQYLLACQVSGAISICLPRTSKYLYLLEIYINAKTEV
jgi:hypothetical protein